MQPLTGHGFSNGQYTPKYTLDHFEIAWNAQASDSNLHNANLTHSIHTLENCEQPRNDLSVILICFGHVLRRTKPLKDAVSQNCFSV
jgi:hypothetical protein